MVTQFLKDWSSAIDSRKLVREVRSPNGVILYQDTVFTFMNHKIHIFYSICNNYEHMNPKKYIWKEDILVEDTNKSIPSRAIVKCSNARYVSIILNAITFGRDHDDRVHERMNRKKHNITNEIRSKRLTALKNTSYTEKEKEVIVNYMQPNVERGLLSWDDTTIDILKEYHNYITGRGLIEVGIDLGAEDIKHLNRMYNLVAELLMAVERNSRGGECINSKPINYLFLQSRENIAYSIYVLRSTMAKIYDVCGSTYKLVHVLKVMAALYEAITGVKLADKQDEVRRIKEERKERKLRSAINGNKSEDKKFRKHKYNNSIRTKPIDNVGANSGAKIDDAFGDILNNITVDKTETVKPVKEEPKVKTVEEVLKDSHVDVTAKTEELNKEIEESNEEPLDLSEPIIMGSAAVEESTDDEELKEEDFDSEPIHEEETDDVEEDEEEDESYKVKTPKRVKFKDLEED